MLAYPLLIDKILLLLSLLSQPSEVLHRRAHFKHTNAYYADILNSSSGSYRLVIIY